MVSRSGITFRSMQNRSVVSETLLRQWALLASIPRSPRKIDVSGIMAKLAAAGYTTTKRSVQRDLNTLSGVFPIVSDTRTIPYGWSWATDAAAFDLPAMDAATALTLQLVEKFMPAFLPPTVRDHLAPQFARAQQFLRTGQGSGARRWRDCIRVVPREMPLLPPKYDAAAVRVVYESLFEGRRFTARYRARGASDEDVKTIEVNPLGLVVRGNLTYLVCTLWQYEDIRQLVLHRISHATRLDLPAKRTRGFNLDAYIGSGEFQYPEGPMIRLEALFTKEAAAHLYETPLSEDQKVAEHGPEHLLVTATVRDTAQLEWWLLSFGDRVTVKRPARLTQRIAETIEKSSRRYRLSLTSDR